MQTFNDPVIDKISITTLFVSSNGYNLHIQRIGCTMFAIKDFADSKLLIVVDYSQTPIQILDVTTPSGKKLSGDDDADIIERDYRAFTEQMYQYGLQYNVLG